ncbi:hypothetical protein CHARACLAT_027271 [Characodon lateralis]|uniref:Uncharacterized protein n=1 Tax=Characodon lateralis TaxID=208331 RepID=A0ABU7DUM7_9TELE|nr:hypothetical protein [Characodon lateralis]
MMLEKALCGLLIYWDFNWNRALFSEGTKVELFGSKHFRFCPASRPMFTCGAHIGGKYVDSVIPTWLLPHTLDKQVYLGLFRPQDMVSVIQGDNCKFNTPAPRLHRRPCNTNEANDTQKGKWLIGQYLDIFTWSELTFVANVFDIYGL